MAKPKALTPRKPGRPSSYTKEIATIICDRIADGEGLRAICADETMPSKPTVFRWLEANTQFRDQYARAREDQADTYADDMVHIADTESDPQKARVRIDARKWHASKLKPKKYGEKLELAGDKDNPLTVMLEAGRTLDAKLERLIGRKTGRDQG